MCPTLSIIHILYTHSIVVEYTSNRHQFWKRHDHQYFRVWRNTLFMMTPSNGNIFRVTGPMCGEITGHVEFPPHRAVTQSFDVSFDLCVNTWLSKQWRRRWLETPRRSLWRHRNVIVLPTSSPPHAVSIMSVTPVRSINCGAIKQSHW